MNPSNANGTSLFPQGSTIMIEEYYDWNSTLYPEEPMSNCPSKNVSNICLEDFGTCSNAIQGYPASGSSSLNDSIGFLLVLVIGYSLLAGYVIDVLPGENGAALKFYNPLNIRCRRRHTNDDGEDGVVAKNVSKSYGKVNALQPFNLTMKSSQVTTLLGHNGAGL